MKTLDRVEAVFHEARAYYGKDNLDRYDSKVGKVTAGWQRDVCRIRNEINYVYGEDGDPVILAMKSRSGPMICCYRWEPMNNNVPSPDADDIPDYETATEEFHDANFNSSRATTITSSATTSAADETTATDIAPQRFFKSANWTPVDWSAHRGCFVFIHGISESSRFSLLRLKNLNRITDVSQVKTLTKAQSDQFIKFALNEPLQASVEEFEGGWADSLTKNGFVVYGLDLQGHGLSEAWRGSRCNVERMENFVEDVLDFLTLCRRSGEISPAAPTFLSGLSMGGCVVARTCQIGYPDGRLGIFGRPSQEELPKLAGIVFFCPALSAERLKSKFPNNMLVRFADFLSKYLPTVKAAKLAKLKQHIYLSRIVEADPLCYNGLIPIRLSAESVRSMDSVQLNVKKMPKHLPMLLIQSQFDTMTDPEGSKLFMDNSDCVDKETILLDYSWHFLSKEPGYRFTIDSAIGWMSKRCKVSY